MRQFSIRLPEHTRKQIEALIGATGMTITQLFVTIVNDYYTRYMAAKEKYNV